MDRLTKPKAFLQKLKITDSDFQDDGMIDHIADLLERYHTEQLMENVNDDGPEPKYKVGEKIKVANWGTITEPLEILDIQKTFHRRMQEYCWGYKMNGYTGLTMEYVPEGYLRP